MSDEQLFTGDPKAFGGLSNEEELTQKCPAAFKDENMWSQYARKLFFQGGHIGNWQWKSDDEEIRQKQFDCFNYLLGSMEIRHEDKEAIAGWMLSEMLKEVPEYLPAKEAS